MHNIKVSKGQHFRRHKITNIYHIRLHKSHITPFCHFYTLKYQVQHRRLNAYGLSLRPI